MKITKLLLIALFMTHHCHISMAAVINSHLGDSEVILSVTGEILTPIKPSDLSLNNLLKNLLLINQN